MTVMHSRHSESIWSTDCSGASDAYNFENLLSWSNAVHQTWPFTSVLFVILRHMV